MPLYGVVVVNLHQSCAESWYSFWKYLGGEIFDGTSMHEWCLTKVILDKFQMQAVTENQAWLGVVIYGCNPCTWKSNTEDYTRLSYIVEWVSG